MAQKGRQALQLPSQFLQTPPNLTYQCVTHGAAMGNAITTIDNAQTIDFAKKL